MSRWQCQCGHAASQHAGGTGMTFAATNTRGQCLTTNCDCPAFQQRQWEPWEQLMESHDKKHLAVLVVDLRQQLDRARRARAAFDRLESAVNAHLFFCDDQRLGQACREAGRLVRACEEVSRG